MSRKNSELSTGQIIERRGSSAIVRQGYAELLKRLIIIAILGYGILHYVFAVMQADGNEMSPAINDGDVVVAYRLQHDYSKNDPVVYLFEGKKKIGRIAACAGDVVQITLDGTLIVNGTVQSGKIYFATYPKGEEEIELRIPENSFFILGDCRMDSTDSRDFGAVSAHNMIGKVITIMRRRGI